MNEHLPRREFLEATSASGIAATMGIEPGNLASQPAKKIKVGIIGCGSVSRLYFPHLSQCPFAEIVSCCDIITERAANRAQQFHVPHQYPNIEKMLAGVPFDLLVNLTDMQQHEGINRRAIAAGKHVWSEKPIANSLEAGQELLAQSIARKVRLWGAPTVVQSPQFEFMARAISAGKLGRVCAGHATYGWAGPNWAEFFYAAGGGSMPDLGVYNLTTLTGLLGPVKSVVAMTNVFTPTRKMLSGKTIRVVAEDNAMVLMEHVGGAISHMQCGFNYFSPHEHDDPSRTLLTVAITGTEGVMNLGGYDWAPHFVSLANVAGPLPKNFASDAMGYKWEQGAANCCECLATGKEPKFTPEHALHVLEIMIAARKSQQTGTRISLTSKFKFPIFS